MWVRVPGGGTIWVIIVTLDVHVVIYSEDKKYEYI